MCRCDAGLERLQALHRCILLGCVNAHRLVSLKSYLDTRRSRHVFRRPRRQCGRRPDTAQARCQYDQPAHTDERVRRPHRVACLAPQCHQPGIDDERYAHERCPEQEHTHKNMVVWALDLVVALPALFWAVSSSGAATRSDSWWQAWPASRQRSGRKSGSCPI
jgi:hypothetical protein